MRLRILFLFILALCAKYAAGQLPGKALHFDGTDDYVMIQDADELDLTGSYTMECWIRPERFNFLAGIISKYNASPSNGYLLRLCGTFPYNGLSFDGMETTTGILQADTWYHIAAVKSGGSRKLYVNGAEYPLHGTPVTVGANTDKLTLGVDYLPSPRYFKGMIDEVRIWNVARTETEIMAGKNSMVDPASPGLVAYYQFESGIGGGDNTTPTPVVTVIDGTDYHNHGTAVNFAMTGPTSNWVASEIVPAPQANAATDISTTGFTANWSMNDGVNADHFLLDISLSSDFATFLTGYNGLNTGQVTSYQVTGLSPGVTYFYRVRAVSPAPSLSTYSNTVTVTTIPPDPTDNALHFDGQNDYVTIPDADALDLTGSYTLECWIRADAFNRLGGLISKYSSAGSDGYLLRLSDSSPYNGLGFDGLETGPGILQAGYWYHIAAVNDNGNRKLYVNGVEKPLTGTAVDVKPNTDPLLLGADYLAAGGSRFFNGAMDEVRIWNVARTQAEIQAAILSPVDPASAGLVAYYQFKTGIAGGNNSGVTTVTDATVLHNHGLTNGFALNGSTSNWVVSYAMVAPVANAATAISDHGFTVNWTAPSGAPVDHYLLDISSSDDFGTFLTGYNGLNTGDVTTLDVTGLPAGSTWYYRIRAVSDAAGKSVPSNTIMVTTSGEFTPVYSILYVNKNVSGGNQSGDSWENAIPELADALKWAREKQGDGLWNAGHPLQIMVAGGTYKPLYHAADGQFTTSGSRNNAFVLIRNVKIYGGFDPANEITSLSQTRISPAAAGASILSGDLNNSGTLNNTDAYHVVVGTGAAGAAAIDGFRITGGYANGSGTSLTVNGFTIFNNEGGGIDLHDFSPALNNLVISGNYAAWGGGIQVTSPACNITNAVISGNNASNGGGIYASDIPAFALTNVLVTGNRSGTYGGGMTVVGSTLSLVNVTLSGNRAVETDGGGIFSLESTVRVYNSIVYGNNTGIYLDSSPAAEYRYSLVQEATLNDENGNIDGGRNPLFTERVPFTSTPSAAGDYTLKAGSPVINKGSNALFAGLNNNSVDLGRNPRVYDYGGGQAIDPGAYEYQGEPATAPALGGILYVDSNVTGGSQNGDSWENAYKELADALKWARENQYKDMWDGANPLQIWVAGGTYKPLYQASDGQFTSPGAGNAARNRAFVLVKDVKIYGGFSPGNGIRTLAHQRISPSATGASVLSGDLNDSGTLNNGDAYHVVVSTGVTGAAVMDGLRVTGGYANGNGNSVIVNGFTIYNYDGGGIDLSTSSPTLTNLVISGNYSQHGGGLLAETSSPVITNSVISGNRALTGGGGMYAYLGAAPVLTNVTISGNRAPDGEGGGIYCNQSPTPLRVNNSIVFGNTTGIDLYESPAPQLRYSLVQGSTTDEANGNIDGSADPHFTDSPAAGNAPFTNGDYTLTAGSPAIDKGSSTLFTGSTDLAGNPRIAGSAIDMGAFEYSDPLPVALVSFKAAKQENTVRLTWQTTEEINVSRFEIQRSADARAWQAIGIVAAKGSGSYVFTDNSPFDYTQGLPLSTLSFPLSAPSYYRLRITDLDGSFAYSRIEAVSFDKDNKGLAVHIYPNPANSGKVTIELPGAGREPAYIQVFDLLGKEIHSVTTAATELDVSRFSPGVYLVRLRQGSEMAVKKLVVK